MKTKKLTIYAMLLCIGLALSFLESLIPFSFLPGVKLGLANLVVLLLLNQKDIKGSFAVNITRVTLVSILFGTPISFVFSLFGALLSITCMTLVLKINGVSLFGASVVGGTAHNLGQLIACTIIFKSLSVLHLSAYLLLFGAISGALGGIIVKILLNNSYIHKLFKE